MCSVSSAVYCAHIINFCIINSVFPEAWKRAHIIPLPKTSSPQTFNDLRPISILPTLSKILEKILVEQLSKHLSVNKILPINQSGFRKAHSCATALLNITDDIFQATDHGKLTLMTLIDFSKAFDSINHHLLLSILHFAGMEDTSIALLRSYLTNRSQAVTYENHQSMFLPISNGVPQGSVLGPILFLIYMSELSSCIMSCNSHSYADDTQLYISFYPDEVAQAMAAVNYDLNNVLSFCTSHCIKINPVKSVSILFGSKGARSQSKGLIDISLDGVGIEVKDSLKNLGMFLDCDLRFSQHISKCLQKAYSSLRLIYTNRTVLSPRIKAILCDSLVLSNFNHCDVVYNSCITSADKNRIQKMQNSCLRLIFGIRKYDRISHTLRDTKWLDMQNRRYLHSACLFHNIITTQTPPYLYNRIVFRTDVHTLNLRFKGALTPPLHHLDLFKRSYSYCISNIYNNVPENLKTLNISTFRKHLKEFLFGHQ